MKITEERITKSILKWLDINGWNIIAYDFPQSGTGIVLHPNKVNREDTKNKGSLIPDIICIKNKKVLFFENKDRYFYDDFIKIEKIRHDNIYSEDMNRVLSKYNFDEIYFGIGIPDNVKIIEKAISTSEKVDFIIASDLVSIKIIKGQEIIV